jgi:para-nitrobenzyl esterase
MDSLFNRSASLTRRELLGQGSAVLSGAAFVGRQAFAQSTKTEYVEVATAHGRVRGQRSEGLATFKGIPYAGPVSGANRFKSAPPLQPWTGLRDALQLGAPSLQPGRIGARGNEPAPDENCLFLNVWTPAADRRKRPVMFYSHGGGFTTGSGGSAYQDASGLARAWDVVVVATNHRLGLLGYLFLGELGGEEYTTSGNQGLLDIIDGLKWVRENIEAFGGDPGNVMIFGESGGGAKTSCLYAMPGAAPFFHKASIESGPGIRMMPRETATETALLLLKHLGMERSEWRKLLDVPPEKLVEAQDALARLPNSGPLTMTGGRRGMGGNARPGGFGPVVDGNILPRHPFDPEAPAVSKDKPLIVGYNRDETIFFFQQQRNTEVFNLTQATLKERLAREFGANADVVLDTYRKSRPDASPTDLYIAMTTARMIGIGAVTIAERKVAQRGAPVYMYIFTHESENIVPGTQHKVGAAHALEIPYKFNLVQPAGGQETAASGMMTISRPESIKTAHNMSEMWSTFARTGRPAAKDQPAWPTYAFERRATMEINAQCRVVEDPYALERRMWEQME